MSHLMNTYARQPVAFAHGNGAWLVDESGNKYLDALAGIAVNTLGHNHPRLVSAIAAQAACVMHTSNLYRVPQQEDLADRLTALAGLDEVFFCNSGCEANEAAIKIARLYGHNKGVDKPTIIVMEGAFHGRTLATLSATANRKAQAGFEPLVEGFVRVPYKDINAVREVAQNNPDVVAVLLEVIQGEGGLHLVDARYMHELRELCDTNGWLLMLDEVQCGTGRTGEWYGYQNFDFRPDVVTLAKGLASGIPIGACLAGGAASGVFGLGNHGSTFGGNPLACAAALETLSVIEDDGLLGNARKVGELLMSDLRTALSGFSGVIEVRGLGLMIGIELDRACGSLVGQARDQGLLINVTSERVVRLLPPLIFSEDEARQTVEILVPLIKKLLDQ